MAGQSDATPIPATGGPTLGLRRGERIANTAIDRGECRFGEPRVNPQADCPWGRGRSSFGGPLTSGRYQRAL